MNAIRKYFPFLLIVAFLLLLLNNCKERLRPPCPPPGEDYVDSNHYWLFRHHLGDSLTFNVYHVETIDSHHVYHFLREETFVGVDSGEVVEYDAYHSVQHEDGCWSSIVNRHQLCITFKSDRDSLKYMIRPEGSYDCLRILIKNVDYRMYQDEFNYPEFTEYVVEGKVYHNVWAFPGFIDFNKGNKNGNTVSYICYDNGLIRLIINDTLAYLRKPN